MPEGATAQPAAEAPEEWQAAPDASGLVCLIAPVTDRRAALTPAEARVVARAVDKRQHEFATGRWLARRALARFGCGDAELPAAGDRQPRWPAAVTGSITHAGGHVAVAVGACRDYRGIGIDMELGGRVGAELLACLLTTDERRRYRDLDPTLVFSAKEACFKLLFPLFGEFIDFQDVEIELVPTVPGARGVFSGCYIGHSTRHHILEHAQGSYLRLGERWLTCLTLAADTEV